MWGDMMIVGVDPGFSRLKDSQLRIFRSLISTDEMEMTKAAKVEIDGKTYYVGAGIGNMDLLKFQSEISKVLLLADLYYLGGSAYQIVTGLPIAQYPEQKDAYKKFIMGFRSSKVNGKIITIEDVTICPQGVGALYSSKINHDCIIVDVGGRTVDIGLFEYVDGKYYLRKSNTLYAAMEGLYSDIINYVNKKYNLSLESWQGESILRNGLSVDGVKQDESFLKSIIKAHFAPVCEELQLKQYPFRTVEMLLCGGGAGTIMDCIKEFAPAVSIMPNSQFANAIGFQVMGRSIYGAA
jgi:plasmid segregation protein ParM